MHIALSREQIHVGRIFTLESRPFPGRSVYVAQKPLGASGNTWSLQRPREMKPRGSLELVCSHGDTFPSRKRREHQLDSMAELCPGLGSNPEMLRGRRRGLRVPAVPKAPVPAVSKKLLLLCVCSLGRHSRVEHTWPGPGRVLGRYLIRIYYS